MFEERADTTGNKIPVSLRGKRSFDVAVGVVGTHGTGGEVDRGGKVYFDTRFVDESNFTARRISERKGENNGAGALAVIGYVNVECTDAAATTFDVLGFSGYRNR